MKQKNKLWVYDTWHFFEVYAPTMEEAEKQADKIASEIGMDLRLVDNYEEYQSEADQ